MTRGRGARSARRIAIALVAVAIAALVGPLPAAEAHAFLVRSSPADGQVLTSAPTELVLDFSEPIVLAATVVDVVDGAGVHHAPTGLTVVLHPPVGGAAPPAELVVGLPALDRGTYQIAWETLSSDDLHRTTGVIVFGVAHAVTAAGLNEPQPPPLEAGLRWILYLGLAGALGGALASRLLGGGAARTAWRYSASGALAATGVSVILLADQLLATGSGASRLLWGPYGMRWGVREVGLLLLVAAATARPGARRAALRAPLLAVGGVLACVGTALLGHSGAGGTTNLTRVAATAAHLGAAMTWAGAVAVLALVLVVGRRRGAAGVPARVVLQRFGRPAALCVAVMVVTGVYLSSEVVGSVDAALATTYGRTLLLKLALAAAAGVFALVNTTRLHGRRGRSTPRRTLVAEAVVVVGILGLAGVLTSAQPAMEPQLVRATTVATPAFVDRRVADLQETVALSPNRPGATVVSVDVFNTRRPAPGRIRSVQIALGSADGAGGKPVAATPLANGRWSINATLGEPGAITVRVVVLRDGLADATQTYDWTVGGLPDQTRPAIVSTEPIAPVLRRVAGVLLVLLVALGAGFAIVARRRSGRGLAPRDSSGSGSGSSPRPGVAAAPDPLPQRQLSGR